MVYMGSKNKYSKAIIPKLQSIINSTGAAVYVEPFCGGANVIDKIKCERKIGADRCWSLIALLEQLRDDPSIIPAHGDREWWDEAKEMYRGKKELSMPAWKIGAIQFFASFSNGGFPRGYAKNSKTRDYYNEAYKNAITQAPQLNGIEFISAAFDELDIPDGAVVYCDPPYQNTKQYGYASENWKEEDFIKYWNWIRELSKRCYVICSEQTFPDDFKIIWEHDAKRTAGKDNNFKAIERLAVYEKGLLCI